MKLLNYYLLLLCIFFNVSLFSQSDNCSSATVLSVAANCSTPVSGTTAGATASIAGCVGNADDDVWYQFTATATSHQITVTPSASFDPVVQLFSGACASLTSLYCRDNGGNGVAETIYASGLTIGNVYRIRVYHYGVGSGSATFTICLTTPPPPPSNDNCAGAISLTVNAACVTTAGTTVGATQSLPGCTGTADDDVWYSFVATNSVQTITVAPSAGMDAVVQLYSGTCASLTSLYCIDNGFTGGAEVINAVGLVPGNTYRIRVYNYYSATGGGAFTICVTGTATAIPTNDEPCTAIALPAVTAACNYLNFTTTGATASMGAPAPSSCAGGSSPFMGGFSASSRDVWFSIVVPASGNIYITPQPSYGINDGVMALYSGTCSSLTQIACSDDYNYPGTANDLKPYIAATGLTPGATVYLRYWGYGTSSGNFGICVSSPTNDACANALYICDLNGYSSSTSAAYTPDRPCNMRGNAEVAGTYAYTPGTNTGGIFGQGGPWGTGSPAFDVQINNNSWIKFTAAATSATLGVTIGNCWVGNYPSGGIQMQIFSGTNCCSFVPVSDFRENSTGFTITANGLTVGQDYYLMVDGYANDICNYTITANSGVQFPAITSTANQVCFGSPVTLNGPPGATAYEWQPGGQTTQNITVSPSTTTTYTLFADGVCGYRQTLTKTIVVNPLPTVLINSGNPVAVCNGQSVTLSASGANTYSWNTGANTASINVSPATNTSYTVTGTDVNGCVNTGVVNVTVNPLPPTPTASSNSPVCAGAAINLNTPTLVGFTYNWTGPGGYTSSLQNPTRPSATVAMSGTYSLTVTNTTTGCTSLVATTPVVVNALPATPSASSNTPICVGSTINLSTPAASGVTYSWTGPASYSSSVQNPTISAATLSMAGTYSLTITNTTTNCTSNVATTNIVVNPLPIVTVNSGTICNGQNIVLNASGASTYAWNTGATGPSINVNPVIGTTYTVTGTNSNSCSNTAVATVTVNQPPTLTTTPTSFPSNCGQSTGGFTGFVASGSGSLSYSWTDASNTVVGNTPDISNQPAGVYNVSVTDGNGCSTVFGPYSISNPGAPVPPTITANGTSFCVGDPIILTANSGDPLPTYSWTGPNASGTSSTLTIPSAAVADAGVYAVTVTSSNCTSAPQTITILVHALPLADATNAGGNNCSGTTINLVASGGTSYSWTGPNAFTSTTQNPSLTPSTVLMSGTYTVVVTDANGCIASDTANVLVNPTPAVPVASANASNYCEGQSINLFSNSTGATGYSWTGPDGFSSTLQNPVIINAGVSATGSYLVFASALGCNSAAATVNVTVNPNPVATATTTTATVCSGSTINLSATGGGLYAWSGPGGFTSALQNPNIINSTVASNGTYTVIVSNAAGCADTATVAITVNQTPAAPLVIGDTTCVGGVLTLTAIGTGTIDWYSDAALTNLVQSNNTQYSPSVPVNSTGTYYVVATSNGCISTVSAVNALNYNVIASASASPTSGFIPLNVNFTNSSTGVDASDNFIWSVNSSAFATSYNAAYNFVNQGNYTITLVVIDNESGCTDTTTLSIYADGNITFTVPNVFTPNGDGNNDVFFIISNGLKEVKVEIFDRWGLKMYEFEGVNGSWDGRTTAGVEVSDGTYYYLFYAVGVNGKEFKENGHILVVRK